MNFYKAITLFIAAFSLNIWAGHAHATSAWDKVNQLKENDPIRAYFEEQETTNPPRHGQKMVFSLNADEEKQKKCLAKFLKMIRRFDIDWRTIGRTWEREFGKSHGANAIGNYFKELFKRLVLADDPSIHPFLDERLFRQNLAEQIDTQRIRAEWIRELQMSYANPQSHTEKIPHESIENAMGEVLRNSQNTPSMESLVVEDFKKILAELESYIETKNMPMTTDEAKDLLWIKQLIWYITDAAEDLPIFPLQNPHIREEILKQLNLILQRILLTQEVCTKELILIKIKLFDDMHSFSEQDLYTIIGIENNLRQINTALDKFYRIQNTVHLFLTQIQPSQAHPEIHTEVRISPAEQVNSTFAEETREETFSGEINIAEYFTFEPFMEPNYSI